jgi:hypothetical protein
MYFQSYGNNHVQGGRLSPTNSATTTNPLKPLVLVLKKFLQLTKEERNNTKAIHTNFILCNLPLRHDVIFPYIYINHANNN